MTVTIQPAETLQQLNLEPYLALVSLCATIPTTPAFDKTYAYFAIVNHLGDAIEVYWLKTVQRYH